MKLVATANQDLQPSTANTLLNLFVWHATWLVIAYVFQVCPEGGASETSCASSNNRARGAAFLLQASGHLLAQRKDRFEVSTGAFAAWHAHGPRKHFPFQSFGHVLGLLPSKGIPNPSFSLVVFLFGGWTPGLGCLRVRQPDTTFQGRDEFSFIQSEPLAITNGSVPIFAPSDCSARPFSMDQTEKAFQKQERPVLLVSEAAKVHLPSSLVYRFLEPTLPVDRLGWKDCPFQSAFLILSLRVRNSSRLAVEELRFGCGLEFRNTFPPDHQDPG